MRRFSEFLKETYYGPVYSIDLEMTDLHGEYIDKVNRNLSQVAAEGFVSPDTALLAISKLMAQYNIILPPTGHLPEPVGETVFKITQQPTWGTNYGGAIEPPKGQYEVDDDDLYLYFCYNLNSKGLYEAFAVIADKEGLDAILSAGAAEA